MYKGILYKIKDSDDALIKNNISSGSEAKGMFSKLPTINESFSISEMGVLRCFITSAIQSIDKETDNEIIFTTFNSIYRLTFFEENKNEKNEQ